MISSARASAAERRTLVAARLEASGSKVKAVVAAPGLAATNLQVTAAADDGMPDTWIMRRFAQSAVWGTAGFEDINERLHFGWLFFMPLYIYSHRQRVLRVRVATMGIPQLSLKP